MVTFIPLGKRKSSVLGRRKGLGAEPGGGTSLGALNASEQRNRIASTGGLTKGRAFRRTPYRAAWKSARRLLTCPTRSRPEGRLQPIMAGPTKLLFIFSPRGGWARGLGLCGW